MITDVGIDLDGVMYDFAGAFHEYCSAKLNRSDLPHPQHWEFYEDWGMDAETFYAILDDATENEQIFKWRPPTPNSLQGWHKFQEMGIRIHVLTHRKHNSHIQTLEWLHQYGFVPDSVYFGFDKVVLSAMAGDEFAAIDDYYGYYEQYEQVGVKAFMCTQPWNEMHRGRRVVDLLDFANKVEIHNKYQEVEDAQWLN